MPIDYSNQPIETILDAISCGFPAIGNVIALFIIFLVDWHFIGLSFLNLFQQNKISANQ
jgi:hypothetical protein